MTLLELRELIRAEIHKSPGSRDDLAIDIATALHPLLGRHNYLIKWVDKSGPRMCTEPTKEAALAFMLEKCEDPCPLAWALNVELTNEIRSEFEAAIRRKAEERAARLVRVKCGLCGGTGTSLHMPKGCANCKSLGYVDLERWEP